MSSPVEVGVLSRPVILLDYMSDLHRYGWPSSSEGRTGWLCHHRGGSPTTIHAGGIFSTVPKSVFFLRDTDLDMTERTVPMGDVIVH